MVSSTGMVNRILALSEACDFEAGHALRVSKLALRLFDDLQPLHGMGNTEKIWLRAAALLHDIGKSRDSRCHHKRARDIIVHGTDLPFGKTERVIVGMVARYHRGSLPRTRHKHFSALARDDQVCVEKMAALLRVADGLDQGHLGLAEDVQCEIRSRCVFVRVISRDVLAVGKALRKADLFERAFGRKVVIHVEMVPQYSGFCLDSCTDAAYTDADRR